MKFGILSSKHLSRLLCGIILFFLLSSCGRPTDNTEILSYQSKNFKASLQGELHGAAFAGELTHVANADPAEGDSYTFAFTAPDALSGVTVIVQAQNTTVSLNGIRVEDERWDSLAWTKIAQLFALSGTPLSVTTDRDKNEMTVVYQTTDGNAYTLILDSEQETPRWIEGDGIWIEIISFT